MYMCIYVCIYNCIYICVYIYIYTVNDKIYTPEESENMTKREESKDKMNSTGLVNDAKNHQRFRWLADNREKRTRPMLKYCRMGMRRKELLQSTSVSSMLVQ